MKPFLQISIGVSIMLVSASLFVKSIAPAHAIPPQPEEFIQGGTNNIGKYMMNYSVSVTSGGSSEYEVLVWDTETGKSTLYLYNAGSKSWAKEAGQLPASPLQ